MAFLIICVLSANIIFTTALTIPCFWKNARFNNCSKRKAFLNQVVTSLVSYPFTVFRFPCTDRHGYPILIRSSFRADESTVQICEVNPQSLNPDPVNAYKQQPFSLPDKKSRVTFVSRQPGFSHRIRGFPSPCLHGFGFFYPQSCSLRLSAGLLTVHVNFGLYPHEGY